MNRSRQHKTHSPLTKVPFHRLVPNLTTIMALCAGMSSVRFALMERWETAVVLVIIAAVLDGMDGRLARMLGSVSPFGAQLDSLSDFMSFGIAPAFILYHFSLKSLGGIGWAITLVFAVCMSMRLARFNAQEESPSPPASSLRSLFFTGVPAPAAAILGLFPLMLWFDTKIPFAKNPWFIATFALLTACLMVSRIPTYAFKTLKVSQTMMIPLLILAAVFIAGLLSSPWRTLLVLCALYLGLIPHSYMRHKAMTQPSLHEGDGA